MDDDAERRRELRALVAAAEGFVLADEAASGEEAIEALLEIEPDLVLVDAEMPGLDGYETTSRLLRARPATTVVLVTGDESRKPPAGAQATARQALTAQYLQDLH